MAMDDKEEGGSGGKRDRPAWVDNDPFTNRAVIKPPRSHGALARPPAAEEQAAPTAEEPARTGNDPAPRAATIPAAKSPPKGGPAAASPPSKSPPKVTVDPTLLQEESASAPHRGAAAGGPARPSRRRVPTEALPRAERAKSKPPPPYSDEPGPRPPGWRLLRIPLWIWLLALISILVIIPLLIDLLNRDRFRLSCDQGQMEAKQHRRFPWPVGFERMGGPLRPAKLFSAATCAGNQDFRSRDELEAAFLEQMISQVRRGVANPASRNLKVLRAQLNQAQELVLLDAHLGRRKEVKQILADLSYREGRARLGRVEMNLREALALLREAQKLAGERHEDLADWIGHIESLLHTLAPPPTSSTTASKGLLPILPLPEANRKKAPGTSTPPPRSSHPPTLQQRANDGGPRSQPADAGVPPTGSGILM